MNRSLLTLGAALAAGTVLRLWKIDAVGFNSDEAVYAGQAAALAGDPVRSEIFPIFRAHPLLFHLALSALFRFGVDDVRARVLVVLLGLCTIVVTYLAGALLWNPRAGALAALLLALNPYHVIVTRQVLLDGPMTLFTTATLGCLAAYVVKRRAEWLVAAAACLALACLTKETAIVLLGSIVLFFAITPEVTVRKREALLGAATLVAIALAHPAALALAGGGGANTSRSYLVWQLLRRPNHDWTFYFEAALPAIGWLLLIVAIAALIRPGAEERWKLKLLMSWIAAPVLFFQLWPVKGFQYLLPIAPALALLAAGVLARTTPAPLARRRAWLQVAVVTALILSLAIVAWDRVSAGSLDMGTAGSRGRLLAGAGGVPGGRAAGEWIRNHAPRGAALLTIGPSMANILQFYGERRAYGLSVSPNPLRRNPAYRPLRNPDLALRRGDLQYVVWDAFSAARTSFFSDRLRRYVEKYDGREVHVESAAPGAEPLIVIYEVRP